MIARLKRTWNIESVLSYEKVKPLHEAEVRKFIEKDITEKMLKLLPSDVDAVMAYTREFMVYVKYHLVNIRHDTKGVIAAKLKFNGKVGATLVSYIKG